ncbi:MAG: DNA glycosylase [Candidatus Nanoarchaeia archaeon]
MENILLLNSTFSLSHTLHSGQFFNYLYDEKDESYIIVDGKKIFKVKQVEKILYYEHINEESLKAFLGLNFNINTIKHFEDEYFQQAFLACEGIRVMKCDVFQTIISFICSAAANISKIKNNVKLISQNFGEYSSEFNTYCFPAPEKINDLELLKKCRVGYRAKYILEVSQYFAKHPFALKELEDMNYYDAMGFLQTLLGIGSKIANCICLFALNHYEAFPVDTWIEKILKEEYKFVGNNKQLEFLAKEYFKEYAGYYQQYLFHYSRTKK